MRLRIPFSPNPRKLKSCLGVGSGPQGRIEKLRQIVTATIRHERIEGSYKYLDEARGYVERLIQEAIKHGDKHPATMEMADFWLVEKDLVHKLFKVLVPRYQSAPAAYTSKFMLPTVYPGSHQQMILELVGNPWPPVMPKRPEVGRYLTNVLLTAARHERKAAAASAAESAVAGSVKLPDLMSQQASISSSSAEPSRPVSNEGTPV